MLYRNIKSGAIVNVSSPVCGDWEPVQKKQAPVAVPETEKKAPAKKRKSTKKTAR